MGREAEVRRLEGEHGGGGIDIVQGVTVRCAVFHKIQRRNGQHPLEMAGVALVATMKRRGCSL